MRFRYVDYLWIPVGAEQERKKQRTGQYGGMMAVIAGTTAIAALMSVAVTWVQLVSSNIPAYEFYRFTSDNVISVYQQEGRKHKLKSVTLVSCVGNYPGTGKLYFYEESAVEYSKNLPPLVRVDILKCAIGDYLPANLSLELSYDVRMFGINLDQANRTVRLTERQRRPDILLVIMDNAPASGSVTMSSQNGDFIGQGADYLFSDNNGVFSVNGRFTARGDLNLLSISFQGDEYWNFVFLAPEGEPLRVGEYADALRASFPNPVKPGIEISGAGRGCNRISGDFVIEEIGFTKSETLDRFVARFSQTCENSNSILTGAVDITVQ